MKIRLARRSDISRVISFFAKYLSRENDALYSEEFFCSSGVSAAIKREQVMIALDSDLLVGAARFYRRKQCPQISLYQFAIDTLYRGKGILKQMLEPLRDVDIVARCPKESSFNYYYRSTGWTFRKSEEHYYQWVLRRRT
jgi:hypothetical protein